MMLAELFNATYVIARSLSSLSLNNEDDDDDLHQKRLAVVFGFGNDGCAYPTYLERQREGERGLTFFSAPPPG